MGMRNRNNRAQQTHDIQPAWRPDAFSSMMLPLNDDNEKVVGLTLLDATATVKRHRSTGLGALRHRK